MKFLVFVLCFLVLFSFVGMLGFVGANEFVSQGLVTEGANYTSNGDNRPIGSFFVSDVNGTMCEIVWLGAVDADCFAVAALYSDDSGVPDALLCVSNQVFISTVMSWVVFSIDDSLRCDIVQGEKYWLLVSTEGNYATYYDDTLPVNGIYYCSSGDYGFSDPCVSGGYIDGLLSLYCVVDVSGYTTLDDVVGVVLPLGLLGMGFCFMMVIVLVKAKK